MDAADFELRSRSFLEWFKKQPGATFHDDIEIVDLRNRRAGRGIIAKSDIPADAVLFTIPRHAILSVQTSDLSQKIPEVFQDADDRDSEQDAENGGASHTGPLDSWTALILVMIYEFLKPRSKWKEYFDVLPDQFETLMFWSEAELAELQASAVTSKIGKSEADGMFLARILPVVRAHPSLFADGGTPPDDDDLLRIAHRMGSTIMAYAFDLENEENDEEGEDGWVEDKDGRTLMGMVPMADVLNADAEFNAHVNHGDESLTVTALRPIKPGEEILNYYGPHPNSELLRRYGYVTRKHSRYDVVEIPWSLVLECMKRSLLFSEETLNSALSNIDPDDLEEAFILERESGEPDSFGLLPGAAKFEAIALDMEEQIKQVLKAVKKVDPASLPDKRKRDEALSSIVSDALKERLTQYSTSVSEDESLIASPEVRGRLRMAVEVRLGEKKLLQEALDHLASLEQEQNGHVNGGHASKRARF